DSLEEARAQWGQFHLVDIREEWEKPDLVAERRPMSSFDPEGLTGPLVLVCAHGVRSRYLAQTLRAAGWKEVVSLRRGLASLGSEMLR
ncbi:rhodanese-like domain-containing protein, partial [Enterococcus faecium]